jgi:transposase
MNTIEKMDNRYYVYVYEKTDGTPYYVGKGTGRRAYDDHGDVPVPIERDRIIFYRNLTETEAFKLEKQFIKSYGRLIDHTGTLHNLHPGGLGSKNKNSRITSIYSEVRQDYMEGYSIKMLSRKYDIGIGTVYSILEGLDKTNRKPLIKESNEHKKVHGRPSNLTDEIKSNIIEEYRNKLNGVKKLSKKYKVGIGTIYKILIENGLYQKNSVDSSDLLEKI